jgi:anti-sigma-K factor RskA
MDAPDGVWERIADEIDENAPPPGPELAEVLSIGDPPRRRRRWSAAAAPWVAAAAAVVAVVAVAVVAVTDRAETPTDPLEVAVEAARADRDSLSTVLTSDLDEATADAVIDQDGHGYVVARDLPTLPDDQTYQLWGVVENGDVISLGIFGPNPEIESFTVEGDVSALAITIEQSPGVISDGNPVGAFVGSF